MQPTQVGSKLLPDRFSITFLTLHRPWIRQALEAEGVAGPAASEVKFQQLGADQTMRGQGQQQLRVTADQACGGRARLRVAHQDPALTQGGRGMTRGLVHEVQHREDVVGGHRRSPGEKRRWADLRSSSRNFT